MRDSKPALLEPIMKVEVETPMEFQGPVSGDLASRRGLITGSEIKGNVVILLAEVPLANMFGYSTDIRSLTQGRATFSMEFGCYRRTPTNIQNEIIEKARKEKVENDQHLSRPSPLGRGSAEVLVVLHLGCHWRLDRQCRSPLPLGEG